jgi:hypothetical protein
LEQFLKLIRRPVCLLEAMADDPCVGALPLFTDSTTRRRRICATLEMMMAAFCVTQVEANLMTAAGSQPPGTLGRKLMSLSQPRQSLMLDIILQD